MTDRERDTAIWRADYLDNAAAGLDIHINRLRNQAEEYRSIARRLRAAVTTTTPKAGVGEGQ